MFKSLQHFAIALLGFSGGIGVGSAFVALLIVLDLIPRLMQIAKTYRLSILYESALFVGVLYWIGADFYNWELCFPGELLWVTSLFQGLFIGMFAAALTEVMNVIPIIAKRTNLKLFLKPMLFAMVLGKMMGSLIDLLFM